LCHNNENYGLTKGQASATTRKNVPMDSSPDGVTSDPLHPQRFALSLGVSFAARVFSGDIPMMAKVFEAGIRHKGFSFIEILQNCPTYNKATPHEWYQQRVYNVNQEGYDPSNRAAALAAAEDIDEKVAVGILYQDPQSVSYMDRDSLRKGMQSQLVDEVQGYSITQFTDRMR
jgi:2-oxoglutarate/2-oxoacid ferredoxin oxidoreductase subunit beta